MPKCVKIKDFLIEEGAAVVRITSADPLSEAEVQINKEASEGRFAGMGWLATSSHKRTHPAEHLPNARSVICSAWSYSSKKISKYFARYSFHEDYHEFILERLKQAWEKAGYKETSARFFVDSKPLAEKAYAAQAGVGWIGKNSLVINKEVGSFLCLGLILTDVDLEPDTPIENLCGDCTKCIEACPTRAIVSPGVIDCNKCVSYLTTEYKGDIPNELKPLIGNNVFGCDICQEVCPYNKGVQVEISIPIKDVGKIDIQALAQISNEEFREKFSGTPIVRLGRERFSRNINVVLHGEGK